MIGKTLGHYQILGELGVGVTGVLYKAHDTHLNRLVAIKVLPPEKIADPDKRERLIQEARAASALSHPNIIRIHDIAEADGTDFVTMEYVFGTPLSQVISAKGLNLHKMLRYAIQVVDALASAHAAGIVHGDLKSESILVSENGVLKILDFGLSSLSESTGSSAASLRTEPAAAGQGAMTEVRAGGAAEQEPGRKADHRTDIFALGALIYEMVSGQKLSQAGSAKPPAPAALDPEVKLPIDLADRMPEDLQKIIRRCLRRDPERRFQHAQDVKIELQELTEELDQDRFRAATIGSGLRKGLLRSKWIWAGSAAVAVAAAALVAWHFYPGQGLRSADPRKTRLTTYTGWEGEPSFSPDGRDVVFAWSGADGGNQDIYRKRISGSEPVRLTSATDDECSPVWSPDGGLIAFVRVRMKQKWEVLLVPAAGGTERKLTEIAPAFGMPGPFLAWSPDSAGLAVVDATVSGGAYGLYFVSTSDGKRRRLTEPPRGSYADASPSFSPDGHSLAFIRHTDVAVSDLHVLMLDEDLSPLGAPRRVTTDSALKVSPVWTPDGREIVFWSGRPGSSRLWGVSSSGSGRPKALALAGSISPPIAVSREGDSLAYAEATSGNEIHSVDATGAAGTAGSTKKLVSSTHDEAFPCFSPSGGEIAFQSTRSGAPEIWTTAADGTNPAQVSSLGHPGATIPRWSPDGSRIVFVGSPAGNTDIFVIAAGGGHPRRLTTDPADDTMPSWSHDGRWVYFVSNRTGERQVWKVPAAGGDNVQVTRHGGTAALESPNGNYLYYAKGSDHTSIWRVAADGGDEVQVLESLSHWSNFDVKGDGIYYVPDPAAPDEYRIRFCRVADGARSTVATIDCLPRGISVSPDRRAVICAMRESRGSDLVLAKSFR